MLLLLLLFFFSDDENPEPRVFLIRKYELCVRTQTTKKGHNKQQHLIYKKEEREREREKKYGCTKIMC